MDPHRLDQLLSSNSSLHPSELSFLRQDIQAREEVIRGLRTQLETLEPECKTRKALLSPLRRSVLPPELLGEILCEVLNASHTEPTSQVVTICLVCRAWREVALATPQLWGSVQVWINASVLEKVKTWLSRSGTLPKRLHVNGEGCCESPLAVCPVAASGLPTLLAEGPSLQELSFVCVSPQCCHRLLERTTAIETKDPGSWDSLYHIGLDMSDDWCGEWANFFHLLPRSLRSLSMSFPDPEDLPLPEPISHPSISTLKLNVALWPVDWTLKTMTGLPRLTEVTLNFGGRWSEYDHGPFHGDDPYILPNVRILRLQNLYWLDREKTKILCFLSTPSLLELELSFKSNQTVVQPSGPDMRADFTHFARVSGGLPNLRLLRLQGMAMTCTSLARSLQSFSSVEHLHLQDVWIYGKSLGFDKKVLPRLRSLEFLNFPNGEDDIVDLEEVLNFIKARSPHSFGFSDGNTAAIQKATISVARPQSRLGPSTFYANWSEILKKEGVDFSFERL